MLTVKDHFALAALTGFLSAGVEGLTPSELARDSYRVADAMYAERRRREDEAVRNWEPPLSEDEDRAEAERIDEAERDLAAYEDDPTDPTPTNWNEFAASLDLAEVQKTYRVYGLGGLTEWLNKKAFEFSLDTDWEIPTLSSGKAYDFMRDMERDARDQTKAASDPEWLQWSSDVTYGVFGHSQFDVAFKSDDIRADVRDLYKKAYTVSQAVTEIKGWA